MPVFPIHDLSRADDIRMRRRRAALLLAAIAFGGWTLSHDDARHPRMPTTIAIRLSFNKRQADRPLPQPDADAPTRSVDTDQLFVDLSCASSVTLLPAPDLAGRVVVSVGRGQDEALRGLSTEGGSVTSTCSGEPGDFVLRVPPSMPLRIQQTDAVDLRGGRFSGPVTIEGTGSGSVVLDATGPLTVRQRSDGDVSVAEVSGPADIVLNGSGDLHIGGGTIPRLSALVTSSGDLLLGTAVIGQAHLVLSGSGDVTADRIGGPVDAETDSSGDVRIGSVDSDTMRVTGNGSGDIAVLGGRIGMLVGERNGSGDLLVRASIGSGSLSHHGSGDVTLPHVTGTLSRTGDTD